MKTLIFLLIFLPFGVNASCIENYSPDGKFLGCSIEKTDTILNTKWLSSVLNIYSGEIYQGISYFEIDKTGRYNGKSIIKSPNEDCVRYNVSEWQGQIYKIDSETYFAWNDGNNYEAPYIINKIRNVMYGNSFLIGGKDTKNVVERNEFFLKSKKFDLNNVLRVYKPFFCDK